MCKLGDMEKKMINNKKIIMTLKNFNGVGRYSTELKNDGTILNMSYNIIYICEGVGFQERNIPKC